MLFRSLPPATLLSPVPAVMISCASETAKPNIITIAWAGIVNSEPPMLSISVRESRFSHQIIMDSQEFVVNLVPHELLKAMDFCGVRSGRDLDKFSTLSLTPISVQELRFAPAIQECPAYLACKLSKSLALGSHTLFIAEILSVSIKEVFFDDKGAADFNQMDLVAYNHGQYARLSDPVGFFGYSIAKPEVLSRRMTKLK